MPALRTTLWVGSYPDMPAQDLTIAGNPVTVPAGDYYVRHATASLSAMAALATAMTTAGLAGVSVVLAQNLRVRASASGAFTLAWGDTELRDMLGWDGPTGSATSHTAPRASRFLWSAGFPGRLSTPAGVGSYDEEDAAVRPSADGLEQEIDHFVTHEFNEIDYDVVPLARYMAVDTAWDGLTWKAFRREVLLRNGRFQLYDTMIEDSGSSSAITWENLLETYRVREIPPGINSRKIDNANAYWRVEAKLRVVPEYS